MQKSESEALKYLAGYCVSHLQQDCVLCMKLSKSQHPDVPDGFIIFAIYKEDCRVRPSNEVVSLLQYAENYFRQKEQNLHGTKNIHKSLLSTLLKNDITNKFSKCHNVAKNLLSHWLRIRIGIVAKQLTFEHCGDKNKVNLSSKSIAMRQAVQKYLIKVLAFHVLIFHYAYFF